MRTTITINDDLYEKAAEITGDKSVSVVVARALEEMIAKEARKRLMRLGGAMPDFTVSPRVGRLGEEEEKYDAHSG